MNGAADRIGGGVRMRLSIMMFLEFFIWGAWLPLIFGYLPSLGFTATQQSIILSTFPIAAIVGMFFSNQFADRNFAAEKFLAFSHFAGGLSMLSLAWVAYSPRSVVMGGYSLPLTFILFFVLMLVHCLFYVPTMSITNAIAFASLKDAQKDFGRVRLWGTIGWIAAAWPFTFILVDWTKVNEADPAGFVNWLGVVLGSGLKDEALREATRWTYVVAGIASLMLAAVSPFLPHTPPSKVESGDKKLAWLEAGRLLRHPFVLMLWIVAFIDAFVHNCYFNWTGTFLGSSVVGIAGNWIMPVMSIGQVAEILTMVVLGVTLKRLGWRWTMVVGVLGYVVRFGVYSFFPNPYAIAAVQLLHGVCYAFFFATVCIFVDEFFPKDARASAQGLFNVMILGIGPLVANSLCPYLKQNVFTRDGVTDFHGMFLVPMTASILAALLLVFFFRPPAGKVKSDGGAI